MVKSVEELHRIIDAIWALYPKEGEPYCYTEYQPNGIATVYVFRSRDESFNQSNAIVLIPYNFTSISGAGLSELA